MLRTKLPMTASNHIRRTKVLLTKFVSTSEQSFMIEINKGRTWNGIRNDTSSLLFPLVALLQYLQTMESGITSARRGRIPLDHGNCTKMERLRLLVKGFKQVKLNYPSQGKYGVWTRTTLRKLTDSETLKTLILSKIQFQIRKNGN